MKRTISIMTIITAALIGLAACQLDVSTEKQITYEVTGTTPDVFITYNNRNDNTSQISNASLPWEHSFTVSLSSTDYFFYYVSAQNNYGSGSVTTKVYVDGDKIDESTSTGAYVISTTSGTVE